MHNVIEHFGLARIIIASSHWKQSSDNVKSRVVELTSVRETTDCVGVQRFGSSPVQVKVVGHIAREFASVRHARQSSPVQFLKMLDRILFAIDGSRVVTPREIRPSPAPVTVRRMIP
jgi:hypothetical protein